MEGGGIWEGKEGRNVGGVILGVVWEGEETPQSGLWERENEWLGSRDESLLEDKIGVCD